MKNFDSYFTLAAAITHGKMSPELVAQHFGVETSQVVDAVERHNVLNPEDWDVTDLESWWPHFRWVITKDVSMVVADTPHDPYDMATALIEHHRVAKHPDFAGVFLKDGRLAERHHPYLLSTNVRSLLSCTPTQAARYVKKYRSGPRNKNYDVDLMVKQRKSGWNLIEIGLYHGVSRTQVSYLLRALGVDTKSLRYEPCLLSEDVEALKRLKRDFTEAQIESLVPQYRNPEPLPAPKQVSDEKIAEAVDMVRKGSTVLAAARSIGITKGRLSYQVEKAGVKSRHTPGQTAEHDPRLNDVEWLKTQYEKSNVGGVARLLKTYPSKVSTQMHYLGIPTREAECRHPEWLHDREWMEHKHVAEQLDTFQIAELVGCSWHYVRNRLDSHNITLPKWRWPEPLTDIVWLRDNRTRSATCVADEFGVTKKTVQAAFRFRHVEMYLQPVTHHLLDDREWMERHRDVSLTQLAYQLAVAPESVKKKRSVQFFDVTQLDEPKFLQQLTDERVPLDVIAAQSGMSAQKILDRFDQHGITKPELARTPQQHQQILNNVEWMAEQYRQGAPITDIANKFGVSKGAVIEAFDIANVERRDRSANVPDELKDEIWMRQQAEIEQLSVTRIQQAVGNCPEVVVKYWLDRHGLKVSPHHVMTKREFARVFAEAHRKVSKVGTHSSSKRMVENYGFGEDGALASWMFTHDVEWLEQKYVHEGRSQQDIADMLGCTRSGVQHALRRHKLQQRSVA